MLTPSGKVSVLVPLYNRASFIAQAIQSALDQDYENFEIIVIDDGSTDGSDKIVETFLATGKVTLVRHPNNENRGQSISLNYGLSLSSGEFIAVLDSDDIFLPGKLSSQVAYLNAHPEVGLVYGRGVAIDARGEELYNILSAAHVEPKDPNAVLLDCYFHLPVGSLVRKNIYDQLGGFDETLRAGQDHDMMIRMAEITEFAFDPQKIYCYRRHGDSISSKGLETRWRNASIILNKATSRYPYKTSVIRKRKAVINFRLAQALFKAKKSLPEALVRLAYAALLDPMRAFSVLIGREKIR